ncbi:unnamed protein product [Calypogeia fissa]
MAVVKSHRGMLQSDHSSKVRMSLGAFLNRGQDAIIKGIEEKIAQFTLIPIDHGEGLQVLHYEVGQKYEAHYESYFHDTFNTFGWP